tara:strand:+ start:2416 stop:2553 length:138 start_codon:yes stop_codon:yes gene_type:complete
MFFVSKNTTFVLDPKKTNHKNDKELKASCKMVRDTTEEYSENKKE